MSSLTLRLLLLATFALEVELHHGLLMKLCMSRSLLHRVLIKRFVFPTPILIIPPAPFIIHSLKSR